MNPLKGPIFFNLSKNLYRTSDTQSSIWVVVGRGRGVRPPTRLSRTARAVRFGQLSGQRQGSHPHTHSCGWCGGMGYDHVPEGQPGGHDTSPAAPRTRLWVPAGNAEQIHRARFLEESIPYGTVRSPPDAGHSRSGGGSAGEAWDRGYTKMVLRGEELSRQQRRQLNQTVARSGARWHTGRAPRVPSAQIGTTVSAAQESHQIFDKPQKNELKCARNPLKKKT